MTSTAAILNTCIDCESLIPSHMAVCIDCEVTDGHMDEFES